jgi:molecular chaperone DnaK
VDTRNKADQLVYQVEKTLSDNAAKFSDDDRKTVSDAVAETKSAIESGDVGRIGAATERLEKASHRLAEVIYRSQAEGGAGEGSAARGAGGATGSAGRPDDVIDAEVLDAEDSRAN